MTAENVFQEMKTKTDVLNGIISLKEREIGYQLELKQLYQKLVDIIVADESSYTLRSSDPREHQCQGKVVHRGRFGMAVTR